MLSRIADSMFWLNRYMERAEGILRLSSVHYRLSLDKDVNQNITWKPVLEVFTAIDEENINLMENNTEAVLKMLLVDNTNQNSLRVLVNKARENARGVQDHITKEVWEAVNQMYHLVNQPSLLTQLKTYESWEVLELFRRQSVLYTGVTDITMSRGVGWQFMNLGKYIERCQQTIAITEKQLELIKAHGATTNDILQWRYLLLSLSGYELHLKTYRNPNHNYNILHQVLINENFTRSVAYSLSHIKFYLEGISNYNHDEDTASLLRYFGRLWSKIKFLDLKKLSDGDLHPLLDETKSELTEFNNILGQHFFSYS